ncbi:MAG: TrkH family potassium uptake protein [Massilibacteroides sp.]|nr:TrkH family potassium uptake protein [Massilibacteroides sp.]
MLSMEAFVMSSAIFVALYYKGDDVIPLVTSSLIMLAVGLSFYLIGKCGCNMHNVGRREGMITVCFTWIFYSLLGMLPYYIGHYIPSLTDAFFETMSGYTTTGSTILTDIESLPRGILFWRSLTQWQGGVGMIVFTVALLPIIGGGATSMYDAETPGITHNRFLPRIGQVAKRIAGLYVLLTVILIGLLWAGPMSLYDAVNHAFTCLSTGGYSTHSESILYWHSAYIDYVISIFMLIGATNMTLIYFFFKGRFSKLFQDEEFKWYILTVLGSLIILTGWLLSNHFCEVPEVAFRKALFHVATLISTTGFGLGDYIPWGPFFWILALMLMFICGCAGSTCGGLKMGRFVILAKNLFNQFKKETHPHAIIPVRMNNHVIPDEVVRRVLAFTFAYMSLIVFSTVIMTINGMGFIESFSAAITAISNVGPALGNLGPTSSFADIPTISKWFLSFLMLVGRLEIFTVLTLLIPSFWKQ